MLLLEPVMYMPYSLFEMLLLEFILIPLEDVLFPLFVIVNPLMFTYSLEISTTISVSMPLIIVLFIRCHPILKIYSIKHSEAYGLHPALSIINKDYFLIFFIVNRCCFL